MYDDDCFEGRSNLDLNIKSRFGGGEECDPKRRLAEEEWLRTYEERYAPAKVGDRVGPWVREEKGWFPIKKEEPLAVSRPPQVSLVCLVASLANYLATNPPPLIPTSLPVQGLDEGQVTVMVHQTGSGPIVVVFDKKGR